MTGEQEIQENILSQKILYKLPARRTVGFLLPGILAYWTHTIEPHIPSKIIGANDRFSSQDVPAGRADYLHRAALIANKLHRSSSQTPQKSTVADFKTNRYDATSGVRTYLTAQTGAFNKLVLHYGEFYATPDTRDGLRPSANRLFQLVGVDSFCLAPNLNYS